MKNVTQALIALCPGAKFVVRDETYAGIEWFDEMQSKPSKEDVDTWLASADHNASVLTQIADIEKKQPRAVRDFALTGDKTRLQKIDADIAALRAQLVV